MTRVSSPAALAAFAAAALAAAPAAAVTTTKIIGVADQSGSGPDGRFGWAAGAPAGGDAFVDGRHLGPGGFPAIVDTGQGEADVRVEQVDAATVDYTFFFGPGPDFGNVTAFVEFAASSATSLYLLDYEDHRPGVTLKSLMVFERHAEDGGVESLWGTRRSCGAAAEGAFLGETCGVVGPPAKGGERLFEDLAGGVYRLGIFDGAFPERGSATFRVTSMPVPMGGALLLGAVAVWRRITISMLQAQQSGPS